MAHPWTPKHILLKAPLSRPHLLPHFQECQGDCFPTGDLCFWQGSLAQSCKKRWHTCSSVFFPFLPSVEHDTYIYTHTHTHTHNAFSFQPAPFILKGKIMVNMPMSYYPHFVDSLARIFHLFTVKPGNSNSKVMSSPILTAYKTMKKDLSNRLSLTAYESESAFELTGHFCSPVAGRQFQSVVVSWMGWWSTLGALWWWKNKAPAWAHLLFCSPLGAPQGRLSSFYRRKKNIGKGTSPDGSLPHSLNYCPRIVQRTICGSVSSSLPEKRHDSVNCEYFTQI